MKTDKRITVLMYHRVDAVDTDPWSICVAPPVFEEQIQYLTSQYPVLSVSEAVQKLATNTIQEHSICITFDDGYADNYIHAKPILEKYNCPATVFIPTAFIGAAQPFWWDELEYIFLHLLQLPQQLTLCINEQHYHYTISDTTINNTQWQQHQHWKWYEAAPTDRCTVFLAVWESLRPLPELAIQQQLAAIRTWAGRAAPPNFRLPMNSQQLQTLFSNSLFTAGLHTHTHPDLTTKEKNIQLAEIEQGKSVLQTTYAIDTNYLAYPYGRYNAATLKAAQELNLTACFTTEAIAIKAGSPPLQLGRYQVGNWHLEELKTMLHV